MKVQRQTKLYRCVSCGQHYFHDDMHKHVQHRCDQRPAAIRQRLLEMGRRYEPASERDRR